MRKRITITIDSRILDKVDKRIDGIEIRNRSHAIESILDSVLLKGGPKRAVIFAGGEGVKFNGKLIPKCLVDIRGKPILYYLLEELKRNGILNIIITISNNGNRIIEYFGDGMKNGMKINYVKEPMPLGTYGALYNVITMIGSTPFFAMNGDQIFRMDMNKMYNQHIETNALATISLITQNVSVKKSSVTKIEGNKVVEFVTRPKEGNGLVSSGVYVFDSVISEFLIAEEKTLAVEDALLPQLAKLQKLHGYVYPGPWYSLDNDKDQKISIKKMSDIVK